MISASLGLSFCRVLALNIDIVYYMRYANLSTMAS